MLHVQAANSEGAPRGPPDGRRDTIRVIVIVTTEPLDRPRPRLRLGLGLRFTCDDICIMHADVIAPAYVSI